MRSSSLRSRGSVRRQRLDPDVPLGSRERSGARRPAPGLVAQAGAAGGLDLGSRIALAADLQGAAGNAATARLLGLVRTDHREEPPGGMASIMATGSGASRGLTRTAHTADTPLFRLGRTEQVDGRWNVYPVSVRPRPLQHDVYWPAPGRHVIRSLGQINQVLVVSEEWSARIGQGEDEHVADTDLAYDMTWGRVEGAINAMADAGPVSGSTVEEASAAAWEAFKRRLPAPLRPAGDRPTPEAQEAKWGAEVRTSLFRRLMGESARARDLSQWHTPSTELIPGEGPDRVEKITAGNSRIPGTPPQQLMREAWDRITGGG
jgi:hypothetical protein